MKAQAEAPPSVVHTVETQPEASALPRLWSARAVAAHWNISRVQVYRAHHAGRLPGYQVLGTLRFRESDLLRLLCEEGVPLGEAQP